MQSAIRSLAAGGLILVSSACAVVGGQGEPQRFAGHYRYGFEVEAFRPCGVDEEWWITLADALRARADALPSDGARVFVVVRGRVSQEGRYGHLGAYPRMLSVVEVLEVRPATDADCR